MAALRHNTFFVSPSIPPGLTLNLLTVVISRTPTVVGNAFLVFTASDNAGGSVQIAIDFRVSSQNSITILNVSQPKVFIGGSVNLTAIVTGSLAVPIIGETVDFVSNWDSSY